MQFFNVYRQSLWDEIVDKFDVSFSVDLYKKRRHTCFIDHAQGILGDEIAMRSSCLHDGISYAGGRVMVSLCQISHLLSYSLSGGHDGVMLPINPRGLNGPLTSHFIFSSHMYFSLFELHLCLYLFSFLCARLKNGRIMPWRCPSVRLSVRPSELSRLFSTCFGISIWNLVYAFSRWHDMSSLSFITID